MGIWKLCQVVRQGTLILGIDFQICYVDPMTETFLNGKITVTSLAAPTPEDKRKLRKLSSDEHTALLTEAIERGASSGISDKTVDDIWNSARVKAETVRKKSEYAL